jgi:glycosyltransferase involved in cell wall biosynthesis
MRIIHVVPWFIPHMGYEENCLPAEQKALGHDVIIVTSNRLPRLPGYESHIGKFAAERVVPSGAVIENGVLIYRLRSLETNQVLMLGLVSLLIRLRPQVVQTHGAFQYSTLLAISLSKLLGYRVFVDDHSHEKNFGARSVLGRLYLYLFRVFYRIFDTSIAAYLPVTESSSRILESVLGVPRTRMEVFQLGANTARFFSSNHAREQTRKTLGVQDNDLLILTAGKFDESKELDVLVTATYLVRKRFANARLILVGNGPPDYMRFLETLVRSLALEEFVTFVDFVPNEILPTYYNAGDLGVWPGTPTITVVEAAATGLPLVVPSHESAYRLLLQSRSAIGFSAGDPKSLCESILLLLGQPDLRIEMRGNALELVEHELSWRSLAVRSIEIYQRSRRG